MSDSAKTKRIRCKHQNGTFQEHMTATHIRDVVGGKMKPIGYNDVGDITHYTYTCSDCGGYWKFPTAFPETPKWLNAIGAQLADDGGDDDGGGK